VKFEVNCFIKTTDTAGKNPKLLSKLVLSQTFIQELSVLSNKEEWAKYQNFFFFLNIMPSVILQCQT